MNSFLEMGGFHCLDRHCGCNNVSRAKMVMADGSIVTKICLKTGLRVPMCSDKSPFWLNLNDAFGMALI